MAKKIYLSPSNQYNNTYATGGTNEMAQCDKIANATASALKRCGFEVKVGKSGDTMQNRCNESDNFKADIYMPIHTNAYNGKVTGGTRVFCLNSNGRKAADAVLKTLGAISPGTADSVSYQTGLYEINVPNALTIYVECEFHDTKTGSDWIRNTTTNIGEAICQGLCNYFGVSYKKSGTTTNTNKPSNSSNSTNSKVAKPDIYYQVLVDGRWLPTVKNLNDFAGIKGKAITGVAIRASKGKVKYRVHTIDGEWLPYVTGYNAKDPVNGYAGNGRPIDAIEIYYDTPTDVAATYGYLRAKYRVSPMNGNYYSYQYDNEKSNGQDGYAGAFGKSIDKLQIVLE